MFLKLGFTLLVGPYQPDAPTRIRNPSDYVLFLLVGAQDICDSLSSAYCCRTKEKFPRNIFQMHTHTHSQIHTNTHTESWQKGLLDDIVLGVLSGGG